MAAPKKAATKKSVQTYGSSKPVATTPPTADDVDNFHINSDLDLRREAQHHTLGPQANQAASGDHTHDGGDSALLLDGFTITGSRGDGTALLSAIQGLVRLGMKDSSTP